jgi:hypothetical protein
MRRDAGAMRFCDGGDFLVFCFVREGIYRDEEVGWRGGMGSELVVVMYSGIASFRESAGDATLDDSLHVK